MVECIECLQPELKIEALPNAEIPLCVQIEIEGAWGPQDAAAGISIAIGRLGTDTVYGRHLAWLNEGGGIVPMGVHGIRELTGADPIRPAVCRVVWTTAREINGKRQTALNRGDPTELQSAHDASPRSSSPRNAAGYQSRKDHGRPLGS